MYQASDVEQLLRAIMGIRAHPRLTRRKTSKAKLSLNLNVGFMTRCNTSLEATDAALASDHIYHGALGI